MTVEEKRKALIDYCAERGCTGCPLHGKNTCCCGWGHGFRAKVEDKGYITNAEIIGAYEIVFGKSEPATFSAELETCDDNSITISNVDKIQSISIYFKED